MNINYNEIINGKLINKKRYYLGNKTNIEFPELNKHEKRNDYLKKIIKNKL